MTPSVLNSFVMGYAQVCDPQREHVADVLHLSRVDGNTIDARHLLALLDDLWPESAQLILDIRDDELLLDMLRHSPVAGLRLTVPQHLAMHGTARGVLNHARLAGHHLLLGTDATAPAQATPGLFCGRWIETAGGRLSAADVQPGDICSGILKHAGIQACFDAGAQAIAGWPSHDVLAQLRGSIDVDQRSVQRLLEMVDDEARLDQIEQALLHEPILAWRLLRHLNSGSHLPVHVNSLRRGLMMLGYGALEHWLGQQRNDTETPPDLRPVMRANVLRARFMEHLVAAGEEDELSREIYFCGLFSELDEMLQLPMEQLLDGLPLSERVSEALVQGSGPYSPFLQLVVASERSLGEPVLEIATAHGMDVSLVNRALLRTLAEAARARR